ncbi:RNA polymerase sigma factor [Sorangium cellulosum]|uniref:RNA polymerase sigma factor n=1 Tax=Sorangium cellulosum TaxID=56 RepID=UPI001F226BB4|nr:sigma-70 family RNA polymerase sigma factor [Sorangium cellulosum]
MGTVAVETDAVWAHLSRSFVFLGWGAPDHLGDDLLVRGAEDARVHLGRRGDAGRAGDDRDDPFRRPALVVSPSSPMTPERAARLAPVTEPDDVGALIRRFQSGDPAAFAEIFRRYRRDVARLVFRMLGPTADTEDVIQEVFIQVHRSLGEFKGQSKFTTWLHRVTVNAVLMVRRAARSRPVFTGEPSAELEVDGGMLPDEDAARARRIDAFRRVIARLPEKKRIVYVLHELEGIAPAEIAEIVGAPVLTVRTRLFYARREIEEMMRGEPALAQLAAELAQGGDDKADGAAGPRATREQVSVGGAAEGFSAADQAAVDAEDM